MFSFSRSLAALMLAAAIAVPAVAHTPYLAPASFAPAHGGWVTLDAAFADAFFIPDVVFDNSEFAIVDTKGAALKPARVELLKTRAVIEHQLVEKGTYRFSTGARKGAVFRSYELNGERKTTRDPSEVLPEGAKLLEHFQSLTLAETYITLGSPSKAALKAYGKGFEVVAVTHPNDIYAGEAFRLQVLFEGKPLAEQAVDIFAANYGEGEEKPVLSVKTDAKGFAEVKLSNTGSYLLQSRYRHAAPADAAAPKYSYTYTLSFAVDPR